MTKVAITGSEGFIGQHLISNLKEKGNFEIAFFDIKNNIFEDIGNFNSINSFISDFSPEIVIHLAANPDIPSSVLHSKEDLEINTGGTINVLKACAQSSVKQFIFASTAQIYGDPQKKLMDEDHPINPLSPYAISKLSAENYIKFYANKFDFKYTIFRFFNIYGEGQIELVVFPSLINKINKNETGVLEMYGAKDDSRDFVYVGDLCDAFHLALDKKPDNQIINIGSGDEIFILDLAKEISKQLEKKMDFSYSPNFVNTKLNRMQADVSKAKKILGWESKTTLEKGVSRMLSFYK